MKATASDEIDADAQALFDLMRDGVITSIGKGLGPNSRPFWRVTVKITHSNSPTDWETQLFDSSISALDAFLKARVAIFTRLMKGQAVYSPEALKKRRELQLD